MSNQHIIIPVTGNRLKWEYLGLFVESRRTAKSLSIDEVWSEESWHGHGSKFDPQIRMVRLVRYEPRENQWDFWFSIFEP